MREGQRCIAIITINIFYLQNIDVNVIRKNAMCNIYVKKIVLILHGTCIFRFLVKISNVKLIFY